MADHVISPDHDFHPDHPGNTGDLIHSLHLRLVELEAKAGLRDKTSDHDEPASEDTKPPVAL